MKSIVLASVFFVLTFGPARPAAAQDGFGIDRADGCAAQSPLSGLYRIDVSRSDSIHSVIENASSSVPYNEQQQFFLDLTVRLAPPDLLSIECRGRRVSLASSRADRIDFVADGRLRQTRGANGQNVSTRIAFARGRLIFTSTGEDDLSFTFRPLDDESLEVRRSISAKELLGPLVIRSVYRKIAASARWDLFDNRTLADDERRRGRTAANENATIRRDVSAAGRDQAEVLRRALDQWIEATNRRDIERQMTFYEPTVQAFYLARNVSHRAVREEKNRIFRSAREIDIRAAEPEIVFQNGGATAVMRFRKTYEIARGAASRRGEVVQELRWRRTARGWKIFSERDIKVIR